MHPHVDFVFPLVVGSLVLDMTVFGNGDFQNGLAVDLPFFSGVLHFWLTVHLCSCLNHVDLFLRPNPSNGAVVFDSNQKPATIGVRKSSKRPGNSATVGNLKLEIQLLMLAFFNQFLYVLLWLPHVAKVQKKDNACAFNKNRGVQNKAVFKRSERFIFWVLLEYV